MTLATLPLSPPGPSPFGEGSFEDPEPEFSATPPPMRAPMAGAPQQSFSNGPPPGRRGLPRPGGYLEATYSHNVNLHMPPAPPEPAVFDPSNGFGFPETVDFRSGSQPVVVRRSGPPGLLVLIVMLAAAAGGAKLGHVVTRDAVAKLDAVTAAGSQQQGK
jgi:hypothetical protein